MISYNPESIPLSLHSGKPEHNLENPRGWALVDLESYALAGSLQ